MRRRCLEVRLSHLVKEGRKCHWLEHPVSTVDFWRVVHSLNKDFPLQTFAPLTLRLAYKLFRVLGLRAAAEDSGKNKIRAQLQPLDGADVTRHLPARQVQQMRAVCVQVASERSLSG